MKVLIVEDNESLRDLLARILEHLDYLPILACDGKAGLEKALAEKPDLILMDMLMPVMDGWQAARALRANPETKDIPILATTALFSRSSKNVPGSRLRWLPREAVYRSGTPSQNCRIISLSSLHGVGGASRCSLCSRKTA